MSEQLDHPLSWGRRLLLKLHLMMCLACETCGRQIKDLKTFLGQSEIAEPPSDATLSPEARQRMQNQLHPPPSK